MNRVSLELRLVELRLPAMDDHAELRPPIADMVIGDDLVADETRHAGQRVADERAANVTHMHRFGDIRRGEIDHDGLRLFDLRNAHMVIFDNDGEPLSQCGGAESEVQKAGAVYGDFFAQIFDLKRSLDLLCECARIRFELLGQDHRRIALVVAKARVGGDDDTRGETFRQINAGGGEGSLETGREEGAEHGWHAS